MTTHAPSKSKYCVIYHLFFSSIVLLSAILLLVGCLIWPLNYLAPKFLLKTSLDLDPPQRISEHNLYSYGGKKSTPEVHPKNVIGSAFSSASMGALGNRRPLQASSLDVLESEAEGLSEERELHIQEDIFHSPSLFLMNYQDMLTSLKIYIYPSSDNDKYDIRYQSRDANQHIEGIRQTDEFLFRTLTASSFATADPEEAGLFFIPISMNALWDDLHGDSKKIANYMRGYIQQLRDRYPYWDRTLGTDHVFVSCHDFKADSSRNVLELKKNAIQIACSPLAANGTQDFLPHKDITLPLIESETFESKVCKGDRGKSLDREHTVCYGGSLERKNPLAKVSKSWTGMFLDSIATEHSRLLSMFFNSKFCLSLGASDRVFIIDSLRCGCIPVVFSSSNFFDLPFQDILNWHKFSVILNSKEVGNIQKILTSIPEKQLKAMQDSALEAAKHMDWLPLSNPFSAFHLVMYELWIRSRTIRYKRRDVM